MSGNEEYTDYVTETARLFKTDSTTRSGMRQTQFVPVLKFIGFGNTDERIRIVQRVRSVKRNYYREVDRVQERSLQGGSSQR